MKKFIKKLVTAVLLIVAASCSTTKEHYVTVKPETITTARTEPPFAGAIWIGPEYRWSGSTYVVEPAHWAKPVKTGVWVPGHWRETKGGYTWVSGYWK